MTLVTCNEVPFIIDSSHPGRVVTWDIPLPPGTKYYGGTVTLSYSVTGASLSANPFNLQTAGGNATTITHGTSSTTQTLISFAGIVPGSVLHFATSGVDRTVDSIVPGGLPGNQQVILTSSVSTTTGEVVTGSVDNAYPNPTAQVTFAGLMTAATSSSVTGTTTFPVKMFDYVNDRINLTLTARITPVIILPSGISVNVTAITLTLLDTANSPSSGIPGKFRSAGGVDQEPASSTDPTITINGVFPSGHTLNLVNYVRVSDFDYTGAVPTLPINFTIPVPPGNPFNTFLGSAQIILKGTYAPTDERGTLQITSQNYDPNFSIVGIYDSYSGSATFSDDWEGGFPFAFDGSGGSVYPSVTIQTSVNGTHGINNHVPNSSLYTTHDPNPWQLVVRSNGSPDQRDFAILTISSAQLILHYCPANGGANGTFHPTPITPPYGPPGIQYSFTIPNGTYLRSAVRVNWVRGITGGLDSISVFRPSGTTGAFWSSVLIPPGNAGDTGSTLAGDWASNLGVPLSQGGTLILGFLNVSGNVAATGGTVYSCSGASTSGNGGVADTFDNHIAFAWVSGGGVAGPLKYSVCRNAVLGNSSASWEPTETIEPGTCSALGIAYLPNGRLYLSYTLSGSPLFRTNDSLGQTGQWSTTSMPDPPVTNHSSVGRGQQQSFRFRALTDSAPGDIEFSQCRDATGTKWTTPVTAISAVALGPWCGGVYVGEGYGCIYTKQVNNHIYYADTADPENWVGVGDDTGKIGRVVGATRVSQGVIIGVVWDSTSKKTRCLRSRDLGNTWEIDGSNITGIPDLDTPPCIVSIQSLAFLLWQVSDAPAFLISSDGGSTWT